MDFSSVIATPYAFLHNVISSGSNNKLALLVTIICIIMPYPLYYLYRYRSAIKARVKEIEEKVRIKVIRNKNDTNKRVICMELDPNFVKDNPQLKMMSLGEYLSQLKPAEESSFNHLFLQKELEITIGDLLLKSLGKTYGAALLPILGAGSVASSISGLSSKTSKFFAKCILSDGTDADTVVDPLSLDLSLMEIVSFVNLYQKTTTPSSTEITPLQYLSRGENAAGPLAYDLGDGEFPMTFDILNDFEKYVTSMEERILEANGEYDPNDMSFPESTSINERLLPGLQLGKGTLKYTHTKREGVEHRLLCVLLNKMSHNYYTLAMGDKMEDCFKVLCNGKECIFPEELIEALRNCGHKVEVCPRVTTTNFGMQLCLKEDDGTFTYIPTTLMLRTSVERTSDRKAAYFAAPHGGMDLRISGPIVGKSRPAWLQFYVSIGGLCCFHPDEDQDAPWAAKTSLTDVYSDDTAITAIRMCAIVSVTFNRIASELNLPFGGYGILGMCNDSATLIDFAIRKKTSAYPLLSTGRYLNHIVNYLIKLKGELSDVEGSKLQPVLKDILSLIRSTSVLPSDLHISPSTLIDMSDRYDISYGLSVFQGTSEAKAILKEMANTATQYLK